MNREVRRTLAAGVATMCAAALLAPLLADLTWLPQATAVVALVAACGLALRALGVVAALVAAGQLVMLALVLPLFVGALPSPGGYAEVVDVAGQGLTTIRTRTAPVPVDPGIALLVLAGVGVLALAIDALAVGIRSPAWVALPVLGLMTLSAALSAAGPGPVAFAIAAGGWLLLLVEDARDRVGAWGRHLVPGATLPAGARPDGSGGPLAATGRRLGVLALLLAVAIPAALPDLPAGSVGFGGSGGLGGGGGRQITLVNPVVDLRDKLTSRDSTPVVRYRTDDPQPDYLRMYTLDVYDGLRWTFPTDIPLSATRIEDDLPQPTGLDPDVPTRTVTTTVRVTGLGNNALPVPAGVRRIDMTSGKPQAWRYDVASGMVLNRERGNANGTGYTVTSLRPRFAAADLAGDDAPPAGVAERFTDAANIPNDVARAAESVTAAARTPYEKAWLLQSFFRSGSFRYSLDVPDGASGSEMIDFLWTQVGYCKHFASTMAAMARTVGLPSRVAVGFTPGRRVGDEYLVSARDAHAWPEIFLPGAGWTRFEPTPPDPSIVVTDLPYPTPSGAGADLPDPGVSPSPSESAAPTDAPTTGPDRSRQLAGDESVAGTGSGGGNAVLRTVAVLAAVLIVLLAIPAAVRALRRRRRFRRAGRADEPARALAEAAWATLDDDLVDRGMAWPGSATPRQAARHLTATATLDRDTVAALDRLAVGVERARFAATPARPVGGDADAAAPAQDLAQDLARDLTRDVDAVVAAVDVELPRRRRIRAAVLPRSAWRRR